MYEDRLHPIMELWRSIDPNKYFKKQSDIERNFQLKKKLTLIQEFYCELK